MANINDYLQWRGDIPLNKYSKFNEVDDMILARFSYLLFDRINLKNKETIESISSKMKDFPNDDFRYNGDKNLITNLGNSARFKDMIVTDFVKNTDKEVEKQFSAITIHLSDKEMYISYIGTDSTIVGWKEDFNLAFMQNIPAQIEGLKYLRNVAKKYPNKKIRIGGHSKGGNVAVYSAISSSIDIQNRIISVSNYDGPGFNSKIINTYKNTKILNKIITYLPQDSIIGRILEHEEKCEIVESVEKGIYQHDIYSWQVIGNHVIRSNKLTDSSNIVYKTTKDWLSSTTAQQRQLFFDGIFEVFYSTSANTFGEISNSLVKNMPILYKTYKEISEEDRKLITSMLKNFIKAYTTNLKQNETEKIKTIEIKNLKSKKTV